MMSATLGGRGGQWNSDILLTHADRGGGGFAQSSWYKMILWVREKWSKWFKSSNKPLRYSFFLLSQGLKKWIFQTKWKISLRPQKSDICGWGGEGGGGPKWHKKGWRHNWTAPKQSHNTILHILNRSLRASKFVRMNIALLRIRTIDILGNQRLIRTELRL